MPPSRRSSRKPTRRSNDAGSPAGCVRIQKYLAAQGLASRRAAEELVEQGRVEVNDSVVTDLPCFVDPERDEVAVDGRRVRQKKTGPVYFLLNKPKGVVCTSDDPAGRAKAVDFVRTDRRVFCVGRLDADSTGLILLTDDGDLTQHLTHPSHEVPKTYVVTVDGRVTGPEIERIKGGVSIRGGRTGQADVKVLRRSSTQSLLRITLREGRNREIRRILLKLGHKVRKLKRIAIGPVDDRGLKVGKVRKLTRAEVSRLYKAGQE
jgi:23S rRNA pseudouridine2605 synthase